METAVKRFQAACSSLLKIESTPLSPKSVIADPSFGHSGGRNCGATLY